MARKELNREPQGSCTCPAIAARATIWDWFTDLACPIHGDGNLRKCVVPTEAIEENLKVGRMIEEKGGVS